MPLGARKRKAAAPAAAEPSADPPDRTEGGLDGTALPTTTGTQPGAGAPPPAKRKKEAGMAEWSEVEIVVRATRVTRTRYALTRSPVL